MYSTVLYCIVEYNKPLALECTVLLVEASEVEECLTEEATLVKFDSARRVKCQTFSSKSETWFTLHVSSKRVEWMKKVNYGVYTLGN